MSIDYLDEEKNISTPNINIRKGDVGASLIRRPISTYQ
jgi:hypothetical protein